MRGIRRTGDVVNRAIPNPIPASTDRPASSRSATASLAVGRGGATWPRWLMGALVVAYILGLLLPGVRPHPFVELVLGNAAQWVPVIVVWCAVFRTRLRRPEFLFIATGLTLWAGGGLYDDLAAGAAGVQSAPSLGDAGRLLFYPLVLAALVVLSRRTIRTLTGSVLLDVAVGALGGATLFAVLLDPVFRHAASGPVSLSMVVAFAYPLGDVLLVAMITGMASAPKLGFGPAWMVLAIGLSTFADVDAAFAILSSQETHAFGSFFAAGWALCGMLIACWADAASRVTVGPAAPASAVLPISVPLLAVCIGLGALLLGTRMPLSTPAVVLATATVAAAAVPLPFRHRIVRREARTDELTGLPNRRAFYADGPALLGDGTVGQARTLLGKVHGARFRPSRSSQARPDRTRGDRPGSGAVTTLATSPRVQGSALLLLDLDRFKDINDSLGHQVGDRLLVMVGERLAANLGPGDLLARLGGDEFAIVLRRADEAAAVRIALRLRAALAAPFTLPGIGLQTSASIGVALAPAHGRELSVLLSKADIAMYKAKGSRGGHHVYTAEDDGQGEARLRTLAELRLALSEDQLLLHYQPKVQFGTELVAGVEALVRWQHPGRGLLYPDSFLPLVEDAGLMHELTRVVLTKALDQALVWQECGRPLTIAVNLLVSSLVDTDLPARIAAMIADRGLPASVLMLEITESFFMADRARALDILTRLRDAGIQISIDDLGTGYSSLAYLRELPIDELKLDRSFVLPMSGDPRAAALVASTIELAHKLGLRIVAEGVEDGVALAELDGYGCDSAQGFFLSHPVPAEELDTWLAARRM